MIDTLTSTPFFGLGVTLLCWYLAVRFQKRTGLLICNPVLVASLLVIGIMLLFSTKKVTRNIRSFWLCKDRKVLS